MARYKNSEGYADTTAYNAELNIEKQRKREMYKAQGRYLKYGKGYPVEGYMIGELYCFKLAARKLGIKI